MTATLLRRPVTGLQLDPFGKQKFQATLQELLDEKEAVKELLPSQLRRTWLRNFCGFYGLDLDTTSRRS